MRQPARFHLEVAALLTLLVITAAAAPVSAAAAPVSAVVPATAASTRFHATELYAYKLINCLRTGGKVTTSGQCVGYGSGTFSAYREPLEFSQKISNKVAWPYAGRIATAGQCRHDLGGSVMEQRFRTFGLRNSTNGENLACHWAVSPRRMVIYWVRRWYKETSDGGAHWHQIKDPDFRVAGFGVARHGSGRVTLVIDFYGKVVD